VSATKPIPIRLSEDITKRLDECARRIGNNRASLIRLLLDTWLSSFEKHGEAVLPPDWQEIMASYDHRIKYRRSPSKKAAPAATPANLSMNEEASSASDLGKEIVEQLVSYVETHGVPKPGPSNKARSRARVAHHPEAPPTEF